MSPSPNVAIVSPMPSSARSERSTKDEDLKKDEAEDALQGIAPMAPLGMFRGRESRTSRDTHSPNTTPGTGCSLKNYSCPCLMFIVHQCGTKCHKIFHKETQSFVVKPVYRIYEK